MKYSILILLAALALPFAARSQAVILKTDTVSVSCSSSDTFLVPVRVRNFTGVASMQFTLSWTPSQLKYAYVTPGANNPFYLGGATAGFDTTTLLINQGKLTFAWTKQGGASYPDDTPVFFVAFRRLSGPFSPVTFVNAPVGIEVTDKNADELPFQLMPGGVLPIDTVPPTITCPPSPPPVQSSGPAPVNGISPTSVADNCTVQQVGWSVSGATTGNFPTDPDASGAIFNFGTSTVVYRVTDVGNATATCSFTIMVEPSNTSDTLTIVAGGGNAGCGQSIAVPITALNFDSLGSLQFSVQWDTAVLKFDSVTFAGSALTLDVNNFGTIQVVNGFLSFSWTSPTSLVGTTIQNGSLLFRVHLSPKNGNSAMTQIGFGDFPAFREAYTSTTNPPEEVPAFYIPGQINVADNTAPSIVCPQSISVQTQPGELTASITGTSPTVTDNCTGAVALTYAQSGVTTNMGTGNANGTYNAGSTTVTYTATDASGNTATCTFQVLVDAGKPVLLALDSVETSCAGAALQTIAVDLTVGNFQNLIGLQFSIEWDETALSLNSVTDIFPGLGLTANSSAFIYVDTAMGILRFLGGTTGMWPNIQDGGVLFTLNFTVKTPGALSPIKFLGPFDAANQAFQSVPVSTLDGGFKSTADVEPPQFIYCPNDTLVMATLPNCTAIVNFLPIVTDDCSGVASLISPNHPGNTFDLGMTLVTYVATDSVGNTSECGFQVFVEAANNTLKLTNCPPNLVTGFVTATDCKVPVFWQEPDVTGLCDFTNVKIEVTFEPGDSFMVNDPKLVVFVATDTITGDKDLCSWTVTVLDTIAPKLTCPKDTTLLPNSFNCSAVVGDLNPTASDNCDNALDIGSTKMLPKDTFPIGMTPVTVIASDDSGNFSSCVFKVTVIDNEAPFFICPKDTSVSTNPGTCVATVNWITPQAFDNCDTTILVPIASIQSGSDFMLGTTTVTYSSTDAEGNKASCSFTVTVTDTEFPKIDCPSDIVLNLPTTKCDTMLNWQPAFPSDNCGIKSFGPDIPQGSVFEAKTTLVTYTVEDNAGNTATCAFSITAKDGVRPLIANCPKDTTVNSNDPCGAKVSWDEIMATDNCTPVANLLNTKIESDTSGTMFSIATTGVQITVADASGNVDTCKFNVKVLSAIIPGFDFVPPSQTLVGCEAIATWDTATVKGFCMKPIITSSHQPGDKFQIGTTVVTYTATDGNGTTYTATFSITVSEMTPPVLSGCPTDSILVNTSGTILSGGPGAFLTSASAGPNCTGAVLNFVNPTATDNCGLAVLQQTTGQITGSLFMPGSSVITFQAADASANTATCSVKVTVVGVALPEVMLDAQAGCPGGSLQLVAMPSVPGATYTWTGPQGAIAMNNDTITITDLNQANIGQYKVVVSLGACASASDSTTVTLAQKPDAMDDFTFTIDPGATDTFDVLANDVFNAADFKVSLLTPQTGLSQLTPGSGQFLYTAGQVGGKVQFMYKLCSMTCPTLCDEATVNITVRETDCTFVPNIITPNGDPDNEVLVIPCLDNSTLFRSNSLVIYNQWGDKVFEASPYLNNWGGTLDNEPGKDLPDGTYFYIFRPGPNEAVLKGFVEIYR